VFRRFIVGAALGAAAMYFLDPENGQRRSSAALQAIDTRLKSLLRNDTFNGNSAITSPLYRERASVGTTSGGARTRPKTTTP